MSSPHPYTLPPLPYAYDALEPSISAQIMELHHSKHHATYITNLNAALSKSSTALSTHAGLPSHLDLQQAVKFNGGGHVNHTLFWANLCPASSPSASDPETAAPELTEALKGVWGSLERFKESMGADLLGIQGSGWGWLVCDEGKRLRVVTTRDQDIVPGGLVPVLGVDMWEHAYYLQYLNGKAAYVKNIWNVIDWKAAEERYAGGREDVFAALKALL